MKKKGGMRAGTDALRTRVLPILIGCVRARTVGLACLLWARGISLLCVSVCMGIGMERDLGRRKERR